MMFVKKLRMREMSSSLKSVKIRFKQKKIRSKETFKGIRLSTSLVSVKTVEEQEGKTEFRSGGTINF